MKKKLVLLFTILAMCMSATACGKEEYAIPENVKAWCKKHDVDPKEFGVSWLQKQTWEKEKQEPKLKIDYPIDVENAYQIFDEYYEWYFFFGDTDSVPDEVINDDILIDGNRGTATLNSWKFDKGYKFYNDIYSINFANCNKSSAEEDYISVKDAYERGWYYFTVSQDAIGLSKHTYDENTVSYTNDSKDTIEQMLDEIIDLYGTPDYIYTHEKYDTIADMVAFDSIGPEGDKYSKDKVVNILSYELVYDYTDYVLCVLIGEEAVGYDTKSGTISRMTSPAIYIYTPECWNSWVELSFTWTLHTIK